MRTLTRGFEVDREVEFSTEGQELPVGATTTDELEALDQRPRDSTAGYLRRIPQKIARQIRRDPLRRHMAIMIRIWSSVKRTSTRREGGGLREQARLGDLFVF